MSSLLPSWFAADQTFNDRDGWYIGSPAGFRVGPYARQELAEQHSRGLIAELQRCRTTGERVRVVRVFIHEQNRMHGRQIHNGPAAEQPRVQGTLERPPVRAGEEPRVWFRTERVFSVDDVWFFATREGIDVGPYESKAAAERDARRLAEILEDTESEAECRLAILQFKSRPQVGAGGH